MIRTTPFYPRLRELNTTGLWSHWAGYLSAQRYDTSAKHEYFGIRHTAGYFDSSPLYKYWIRGRDAERFLAGVLTRDVRPLRPGRAHYTVWCDDDGYVLEDGVLFRYSANDFMLTCAEPNLGYLSDLVGGSAVQLDEVSADYGLLAVQGPRSRDILAALTPDAAPLGYFALAQTTIAAAPVTVSRTGYTGDLGYEILVPAADAIAVLDAVIAAGTPYGMRPVGEQALAMSRIEAGLLLIDVEFTSSRFAYTDHDRVTPVELGLSWMLRGIDDPDRPFIGRRAIQAELADGTSRWRTVGLTIDWQDWDRRYRQAGLLPPKDETPVTQESMLYDAHGTRIGYATSLMYSPVLQRHIAIARVRPELATIGTTVQLELTINHDHASVAAQVSPLPAFNPERKTA